ncbi:MAG TPA: hypothetical protein VFX77_10095, partial [Rubrobacter sp.]|nr:hypothetical protein [Rubrobacter sp.]
RCKRIHLLKSRTLPRQQEDLQMTAEDKVAVEDEVEVENPVRIRAIRRLIDPPRPAHPPTNGRLLASTKS